MKTWVCVLFLMLLRQSFRYIWIILTEITFSKNNIQIKIKILIYNIALNYRQVCSNVFDGVTGDHADHNDELLDDQDWEDVPDEG